VLGYKNDSLRGLVTILVLQKQLFNRYCTATTWSINESRTGIIENMTVFSIFNVTEAYITHINFISALEMIKMPVLL
jgi:hypothetical protein